MSRLKMCKKCSRLKSSKDFQKVKENMDGLAGDCKACRRKYFVKKSRTFEGVISAMYSTQKVNSKLRGHKPPEYTREELKEWVRSQPNAKRLVSEWIKSGYERALKPSCDRLDDYKGYSFDNLQLVTARFNLSREKVKVCKPVVGASLVCGEVVEFDSVTEASIHVGVPSSYISNALKGREYSCGGYVWSYK